MLCILRHSRKKTQKEAAEAEYALGKEPKGKRTKAKERLLSPSTLEAEERNRREIF